MTYDMMEELNKAAVKKMDDRLLVAQWVHGELSMRDGVYDDFTAMDMWLGAIESELVERGIATWDDIVAIDEDDQFTGNEIAC